MAALDPDKEYVEYTVTFKIPGPADTYSSVGVSYTCGRTVTKGDVAADAEVYVEAKLRALDKVKDLYEELLKKYETIHGAF